MNSEQLLEKVARLLERPARGRPRKPAPPAELQELLAVYFTDPFRPRLSGNAFLVWAFLLHRADPESRIAGLSCREIKAKTGLRSNRSLYRALDELARFGYCVPSTFPTGHCQPRTYKIPAHITPRCFAHPEVSRLARLADQPRRRPRKTAWMRNEAAPDPARPAIPPALHQAVAPGREGARMNPSANLNQSEFELPQLSLPDLEALNLDEKIEKLGQEVDLLLKALPPKTTR